MEAYASASGTRTAHQITCPQAGQPAAQTDLQAVRPRVRVAVGAPTIIKAAPLRGAGARAGAQQAAGANA